MPTRYAHINIVAHDWRKLCEFYEQIFNCKPYSSERNHHGKHIDELTGMQGVRVQGRHLSVPGHGKNGPTIEIFTFSDNGEDSPRPLNRPGVAHIAFEVDDIYGLCAHLQSKGVVIARPPRDGRMAFVISPDGISVELLQIGEPQPICEPWSSMQNQGSW